MGRTTFAWHIWSQPIGPGNPLAPACSGARHKGIPLGDDDAGSTGLTSIQIFTVMVLVSGATTGVILEMSNDLQQQSEDTAYQTMAGLTNRLDMLFLWGDRDTTPLDPDDQSTSIGSNLAYLEVTARPGAGSGDLDLHQTMLEVNDGQTQTMLLFDDLADWYFANGTHDLSKTQRRESIKTRAQEATFTAYALNDEGDTFGPHMQNGNLTGGVLHRGLMVKLYVNLTALGVELGPSDSMELRTLPQQGMVSYELIRTPDTFSDRLIKLA